MSLLNSSIAALMHLAPKWLFRPFANSYVAGESIDSALKVVKILNEKGFSATMDILQPLKNFSLIMEFLTGSLFVVMWKEDPQLLPLI